MKLNLAMSPIVSGIVSDVSKAMDNLLGNLGLSVKDVMANQNAQNKRRSIAVAAVLFVILQFELFQLVFMVAGAGFYWLTQGTPAPKNKKLKKAAAAAPQSPQVPRSSPTASGSKARCQPTAERKVYKTPTMMPIEVPVFQSTGFDAEVSELCEQLKPSASSDAAVRELASIMERTIREVVPEAEAVGLSCSDFRKSKAFGVAVPDVDVVITVHPGALARRLQGRVGSTARGEAGQHQIQKAAIRMCAELLVTKSNFKFRRSAFRGSEPKITLLSPPIPGFSSEPIPLDLSVNTMMPFQGTALLSDSDRIDSRARELILFVRRWARDRGICHAAKGHLSPYTWTLLTMYFLQITTESQGAILPSLAELKAARDRNSEAAASATEKKQTVGALFKELVRFYNCSFDWRNEAVSVRAAKRAPPHLGLPLHVIVEDSSSPVAPSIEDPLDKARNLGDCMTSESLGRLKEELTRAHALCQRNASLSEVLELWSPPEAESTEKPSEA